MQKVIELVSGGSLSRAGVQYSGHDAAEVEHYSRWIRPLLCAFSSLVLFRVVIDDRSATVMRRSGG